MSFKETARRINKPIENAFHLGAGQGPKGTGRKNDWTPRKKHKFNLKRIPVAFVSKRTKTPGPDTNYQVTLYIYNVYMLYFYMYYILCYKCSV